MDEPDGWAIVDGKLHREFVFRDFDEAWTFMGRVAEAAAAMDHHPDWSNSWNRVVIDLCSHDRGGTITNRDHRLAAAINEILASSAAAEGR